MGLEQSRQVETLSAFSILLFHDSVEMFLKLVAEHNNVKSDDFTFLKYWDHFDLTLKESMRNLNARRVNIKHKGLLPSKSDVEISRVNTTDFFDQNTLVFLNIDFKDVSLLTLIGYDKVRSYLEEAQQELENNNKEICIEKSAIAFSELLCTYENNKLGYSNYPNFFFGQDISYFSSLRMTNILGGSIIGKDDKMVEFAEKVKDSFESIQKAIKIIGLGIDYRRFHYCPVINQTMSTGYKFHSIVLFLMFH